MVGWAGRASMTGRMDMGHLLFAEGIVPENIGPAAGVCSPRSARVPAQDLCIRGSENAQRPAAGAGTNADPGRAGAPGRVVLLRPGRLRVVRIDGDVA